MGSLVKQQLLVPCRWVHYSQIVCRYPAWSEIYANQLCISSLIGSFNMLSLHAWFHMALFYRYFMLTWWSVVIYYCWVHYFLEWIINHVEWGTYFLWASYNSSIKRTCTKGNTPARKVGLFVLALIFCTHPVAYTVYMFVQWYLVASWYYTCPLYDRNKLVVIMEKKNRIWEIKGY